MKLNEGDIIKYQPGVAAIVDEVGPIFDECICECGNEHERIILEPWQANIHWIGDDQTFTIDTDGVEVLDEDEYCASCGQIGCGWN